MFGDLNEKEMDDLLASKLIGRLGLYDGKIPYIVPISYAYDDNSIYCHTTEGLKMEMIRKNPYICFQVDDTDNLSRWSSVICWGNASEITEPKERGTAINKLLDRKLPILSSETTHISPMWPFHPQDQSDITGIILKIDITKKTGRYEKTDLPERP